VLESSMEIWSKDATESCLVVSKLLWQVSQSSLVTNSIALVDMGKLLYAVYAESSIYPQSVEIADNLVSILLQYVLRYNPKPEIILDLPVFNMLLYDVLRIPRSEGASSELRGSLPLASITTRQNIVALYSFVVSKAVENPEIISSGLVMGLIDPELILSPVSRNHILAIVVAFTTKSNLAKYALDGKICTLMRTYIAANHKKGGQVNIAIEHASVIIRNLCLHHTSVLPQMVSSAASGLNELVQTIIKEEILSPATAINLGILFYKASTNYILKHEFPLSPRFVLDSIQRISDLLEEYECEGRQEIITANKFIIGIVLDKYSHGMNIEPTFIQSMYVELNSPSGIMTSRTIPQDMAALAFETVLAGSFAVLTDQLLSPKVTMKLMVMLSQLPAMETKWHPVVMKMKKKMVVQSGVALKTDNILDEPPAVEMWLENSEPFPLEGFEKIVLTFPSLTVDEEMLNSTLVEEDEKEEESEEEEEEVEHFAVDEVDSPKLQSFEAPTYSVADTGPEANSDVILEGETIPTTDVVE